MDISCIKDVFYVSKFDCSHTFPVVRSHSAVKSAIKTFPDLLILPGLQVTRIHTEEKPYLGIDQMYRTYQQQNYEYQK